MKMKKKFLNLSILLGCLFSLTYSAKAFADDRMNPSFIPENQEITVHSGHIFHICVNGDRKLKMLDGSEIDAPIGKTFALKHKANLDIMAITNQHIRDNQGRTGRETDFSRNELGNDSNKSLSKVGITDRPNHFTYVTAEPRCYFNQVVPRAVVIHFRQGEQKNIRIKFSRIEADPRPSVDFAQHPFVDLVRDVESIHICLSEETESLNSSLILFNRPIRATTHPNEIESPYEVAPYDSNKEIVFYNTEQSLWISNLLHTNHDWSPSADTLYEQFYLENARAPYVQLKFKDQEGVAPCITGQNISPVIRLKGEEGFNTLPLYFTKEIQVEASPVPSSTPIPTASPNPTVTPDPGTIQNPNTPSSGSGCTLSPFGDFAGTNLCYFFLALSGLGSWVLRRRK